MGSAIFLVIAPGTVAGLIPWWISGWRLQAPLLGFSGFRWLSLLFIGAGGWVLLDCFAHFALRGLGTPGPLMPTRHLVVTGFYRHVRNPMYVAVVALIFGQGLLLGNAGLLAYSALIWATFHLFVLLYEEPTLTAQFGDEYRLFGRHVRRWTPRLRPWRSPE